MNGYSKPSLRAWAVPLKIVGFRPFNGNVHFEMVVRGLDPTTGIKAEVAGSSPERSPGCHYGGCWLGASAHPGGPDGVAVGWSPRGVSTRPRHSSKDRLIR